MNLLTEEEIFAAAIQKPLPERASFLERACAGDAALRGQVEALLAAHDKPDSFLEVPAAEFPPSPFGRGAGTARSVVAEGALATIEHVPAERPGLRIGRYRLMEQIGEGGMGTVWVAEQTDPVKRRVALKLIKPGMDSRQVLSRFEAERQALALMDHPNIAKVFDGGMTDSGRPYFVMEYVRGVPITEYCDNVRLSIQQRLKLFVQVCQAVQHAHQKGIIHRDLKPSNILVCLYDGQPVPKLLDFGLAKAMHQPLTEHTLYTAHGLMVGTPLYMSPEQAEFNNLDVDTRTDIYSLGVILYELLTGATPLEKQQFKDAALQEILRLIKEVEPERPSLKISSSLSLPSIAAQRSLEPAQLSRAVRGDLDWIVMKALEKERSRRYETANGLARDIDRYLHDEPVEACPPSAGYRLKKLLRRNKGPALAAALILLTLIGGFISTTWGLIRAENSRQAEAKQRKLAESAETTARANEQRADAERYRAIQAEADAKDERSKAITEKQRADEEAAIAKAVNQFLQEDLLAQAAPSAQAERERSVDRDIKLRTVLDRAAARVGDRFEKQPLVDAALRQTIGQAYQSLGDYEAARQHLERAREIRRQALGENHLDTLATMNTLAMVFMNQWKLPQAEELSLQVVEGRRKALGENHPDTLTALTNLADVYSESRKHAEAESLYLQVLESRRLALGSDHPDTLMALEGLAGVYGSGQRKYDQAEPLQVQVLEGRREALGSDHPDTLAAENNLAWLYKVQLKYSEAESLFAHNLEVTRKILGDDHLSTLATMHNLAWVSWDLGKLEQSERYYRQSLESARKVLGGEHDLTQKNLDHLARLCQEQRKDEQAVPLFAELLSILRQQFGPDHLRITTPSINLASCLLRQEKFAEAELLLRESLAIFEQKSPNNWMRFQVQSLIGGSLLGQGKYAEAEPFILKGYQLLKWREDLLPPIPAIKPRLAEAVERLVQLYDAWGKKDDALLASVLRGAGKYQAAEELIKSALDTRRSARGPEDILTAAVMRELAATFRAAGRRSDAVPLYEESLRAAQTKWGLDDARTLTAMNNLAVAYRSAGMLPEALRLCEEMIPTARRVLGPANPNTLNYTRGWCYALEAAREFDKAAQIWRELLTVGREQFGAADPRLAPDLFGLGQSLMMAEQFADAEHALSECLAIREKDQPDFWLTFYMKSSLGRALARQMKYVDAEPLLLAGYEGLKQRETKIPESIRALRVKEALQRLIDLYTAWEKPDEADKWRKILDEMKPPAKPVADAAGRPQEMP